MTLCAFNLFKSMYYFELIKINTFRYQGPYSHLYILLQNIPLGPVDSDILTFDGSTGPWFRDFWLLRSREIIELEFGFVPQVALESKTVIFILLKFIPYLFQ